MTVWMDVFSYLRRRLDTSHSYICKGTDLIPATDCRIPTQNFTSVPLAALTSAVQTYLHVDLVSTLLPHRVGSRCVSPRRRWPRVNVQVFLHRIFWHRFRRCPHLNIRLRQDLGHRRMFLVNFLCCRRQMMVLRTSLPASRLGLGLSRTAEPFSTF